MTEIVNTENDEWTGTFEVPVVQALVNRRNRRKKFMASEPDAKGRALRFLSDKAPQVPRRAAARFITEAVIFAGTDRYIRYLAGFQDRRRRTMIEMARKYPGLRGVFHEEGNLKITVDPAYKVDLDPEKVQLASGPHAPTVVAENLVADVSVPPNLETPFGTLTPTLAGTIIRSAITGAVGSKELGDSLVSTTIKRKVVESQLTDLLLAGKIAEEDLNYAGSATETWAVEAAPIDAKRPTSPKSEDALEPNLQQPVFELTGDLLQQSTISE